MVDEIGELEKREVNVKRTFIKIYGKEFRADIACDFLSKISGTNGFGSYINPEHNEKKLAEHLRKNDIIARKANGGLFEVDDKCEKMHEELSQKLYDMRHN